MTVTAIYFNHDQDCHYLQINHSNTYVGFSGTTLCEVEDSIGCINSLGVDNFELSTLEEIEEEFGYELNSNDFEELIYIN